MEIALYGTFDCGIVTVFYSCTMKRDCKSRTR